ncbi:hypothetical protein DFJ58DRAFT_919401 [Suillus subalutaceus]|uniref:uncharacterized protein n=1 Tax=Suillus subalutaceus TaxID=48586 RepID=UPI001B87DE24|nr:uncharacterized protein DFJ58DRAFT_919401 [Suillus subalutaceus]KAG1813012.1 hypothetical protein DFJ58DRAFT_919401 [Suillus subalutaceus]
MLIEVRRIGRRTTETQKLDIARQRDRLQGQIDGFTRSAITHLGEGFDADDDPEDLYLDILDDLDDDLADFTETSDTWANSPELTVIPLPSNLGVDRCRRCMADDLIPLEMSLREGQANDSLHNLRIHLCNKAILFRTTVTSVQQAVSLHASIYTKTRKQMMQLEPGQDQVQKYKPLLREQLKSALPSAIQMPEVSETSPSLGSGQSKSTLGVPITRGMRNLTESSEVYRVHWLRAKALRDRWKEENDVGPIGDGLDINPMGDRMRESLVKHLPGHACYSGRQSQIRPAMGSDPSHSLRQILQLQCQWLHLASERPSLNIRWRLPTPRSHLLLRITHFKAGLQWEIAYSAARNIISVVPSPVAHILQLIPELAWNMVPDHIFSSHLCQFQDVADLGDPSRIVSTYGTPWWTGSTAIPNELWPWDQSGVEDERLVVPEQVDESSVATLKALRWMRERLLTVIEDQQAGIREKMAEIQMYNRRPNQIEPKGTRVVLVLQFRMLMSKFCT